MTLEDVAEFIVDAEHKTAPAQSDGYPSIRTPNIGKGRLLLDNVKRVSVETYLAWTRRALPKSGDLILAREAPVGNIAIVQEGMEVCLGQRTVLIRPNKEIVDPYFLCYYMLGDRIQNLMQSMSGGSTVDHLNMKDIRNLDLGELPKLDIQQRLASILSAYDDLIENNLKRIQLLEEAAQMIYREWFVEMRFPGHEVVEWYVDDSPSPDRLWRTSGRKLPEGFKNARLLDVCKSISSGGTPKRNISSFWSPNDYGWVKTKELQDNYIHDVEEYISKEGLENSSAKLFPEGTIIMAIYASPTLGRLGILTREACFNQACVGFKIDDDKITSEFLYFSLMEERKNLNNKAIGAAQQNINVEKVRDHEIVLPPFNLIQLFSKIAKPIFEQKKVLGLQINNLKEARDLLLPRLMDGRLEAGE